MMTEEHVAESNQLEVRMDWLESVERCPVCGSKDRTVFASGLRDINYAGVSGTWNFKQCRECGSVYIDPRIKSQHIASAYARYETHAIPEPPPMRSGLAGFFRKMGDSYAWHKYGQAGCDKSRVKAVLAYLFPPLRLERDFLMRHATSLAKTRRVLDFGCGNGDFLKRMKDAGWLVQGVDFDPVAVEVARSRGLSVELGSLGSTVGERESFDLVAASHVVEHVHEPHRFLQLLFDLVSPGGTLWLATPNIDSPLRSIEEAFWNNWETPRHLQMFNRRSLKLLIERSLGNECKIVFRRRGWHIYWSMAQSATLRKGLQRATRPQLSLKRLPLALVLELAALLSSRFGDELVVEIRKPEIKAI